MISIRRVLCKRSVIGVNTSSTGSIILHRQMSHGLKPVDPIEVDHFFNDCKQFVVVGASTDRSKFGNKILRCYQTHGKTVIPVNKKESTIEGLACKASIADIDPKDIPLTGVSIVTGPSVTKQVVQEGIALGFRNFFFQPGTTDAAVEQVIQEEKAKYGNQIRFLDNCVLVQLGCV